MHITTSLGSARGCLDGFTLVVISFLLSESISINEYGMDPNEGCSVGSGFSNAPGKHKGDEFGGDAHPGAVMIMPPPLEAKAPLWRYTPSRPQRISECSRLPAVATSS